MTQPDWPAGYHRVILDEVDSTNAEAIRRLPELSGPAWIFAGAQTAGRGRRGRRWASPRGNFSATLLMHPKDNPADVALRSFIAALALFDALSEVTKQPHRFSLKWPNDVLLEGGKLAGILLESVGAGENVTCLVVGIGVNLAFVPEGHTLEPQGLHPVSLAQKTGITVEPIEFLTHLTIAFDRFERQFQEFGFQPIRALWLDRATRIGEEITARTMQASYQGIFETIDHSGNLVLATDRGRQVISAADVFFPEDV